MTNFCFSLGIVDVSPLWDAPLVAKMISGSSPRRLSKSELEAVHKSLIEVTRRQKSSDSPVEVAMPDGMSFWDAVGQLLRNMETELSETVRDEGMTAKAQLISRRLGVARTCVRDLTRMRLNAFTRHSVSSSLLDSKNTERRMDSFQTLDWSKYDPSERVFYNGIKELSEKYKITTSWSSMLGFSESDLGSPISEITDTLSDFTDNKLEESEKSIRPPTKEVEWREPDFDEEDRIREMDDFPEHAASRAESRSFEDDSIDKNSDLLRIKVLKDVEDPILMADGSEIKLTEGDIESCPSLIAEILISAGLAEAAPI